MEEEQLCPYEVLGLARYAKITEIRKAYKSMALKFHPDRAQYLYQKEIFKEKMFEINDAYALLMNKKRKEIYDRYGIIDDGQTEIVIDESEEMLTKFNSELKDDGFYKEDAPKEEEEEVEKGSFGQRWGRYWRGTVLKKSECPTCHGKKIIQVERGFFTIDEYCDNCEGKGYITFEINDPANPPYSPNYDIYKPSIPKRHTDNENWGKE